IRALPLSGTREVSTQAGVRVAEAADRPHQPNRALALSGHIRAFGFIENAFLASEVVQLELDLGHDEMCPNVLDTCRSVADRFGLEDPCLRCVQIAGIYRCVGLPDKRRCRS